MPVVGDDDRLDERVEFDLIEARTRSVADHCDPVLEAFRTEVCRANRGGVAAMGDACEADGISEPSGQLQHPSPVAADQHRGPLLRRRNEGARVGVHPIVRAVHVDRIAVEQKPDQLRRFL